MPHTPTLFQVALTIRYIIILYCMSHNSKLFFMMCVCLGFHHTASFDRIPASLHLFLSLSFLSVFCSPHVLRWTMETDPA